MDQKRIVPLKLSDFNLIFLTHGDFFLIRNAFCTVVKQSRDTGFFEILAPYHRHGCCGKHHTERVMIAVFIDFLLDQLDAKVPGIVDSGLVSSWLSYRAEPKDFWPVLGKTPVEGYMLSTGFGGNGVIEVPAATRDLAKLIMRDESTPLLENWAFERLLED